MPWNWQQPDWPQFSWNTDQLAKAEAVVIRESGVFTGSMRHLPQSDRTEFFAGDLADLVEKGALIRRGERRHARYDLSVPLRPTEAVVINEAGEILSTSSSPALVPPQTF